jgi:hypothetical protein
MKLKIKMILLAIYMLVAGFLGWIFQPLLTARNIRKGRVALANELGLIDSHGHETLLIDPAAALPIAGGGANGRWLAYERGAAYNEARLAAGVNVPIGISEDAAFQIGDWIDVARFGAIQGTLIGQSGGAITIDHLIGVSLVTAGVLVDLTTAANGTYWCVGRATKTVTVANVDISFEPRAPYQITVTGGALAATAALL